MNLTGFRDVLNTLSVPVFHFEAAKEPDQHAVWMETDAEFSQYADNRNVCQIISGFVEYNTKTEYDPVFDEIQALLNDNGDITWELDGIGFDAETKVITYSWTWRIKAQVGGAYG